MAGSVECWRGTWKSIDGLKANSDMLPLAEPVASQVEGWTTSAVG